MNTDEKLLIFLLWLVGGFVGLHRFYTNNKKQGFILLALFITTLFFTFIGLDETAGMPFLMFFPVLFYFVLINDLLKTISI